MNNKIGKIGAVFSSLLTSPSQEVESTASEEDGIMQTSNRIEEIVDGQTDDVAELLAAIVHLRVLVRRRADLNAEINTARLDVDRSTEAIGLAMRAQAEQERQLAITGAPVPNSPLETELQVGHLQRQKRVQEALLRVLVESLSNLQSEINEAVRQAERTWQEYRNETCCKIAQQLVDTAIPLRNLFARFMAVRTLYPSIGAPRIPTIRVENPLSTDGSNLYILASERMISSDAWMPLAGDLHRHLATLRDEIQLLGSGGRPEGNTQLTGGNKK